MGAEGEWNGTTFNVTEDTRDEQLAKLELLILSIELAAILFGNLVALLALLATRIRDGKLGKKPCRMHYFIFHLSISDLITGVFTIFPQLMWDYTYRFKGNNFLCKMVKYMQIFGPYLSSFVLVGTAIDRYMAICKPLQSHVTKTSSHRTIICISWWLAVICCVPQLFIFSFKKIEGEEEFDCWATFLGPWASQAYVTWYALTVFIIPLIVLIITFSCIIKKIWDIKSEIRRNRNLGMTKSPSRETTFSQEPSHLCPVNRPHNAPDSRNITNCFTACHRPTSSVSDIMLPRNFSDMSMASSYAMKPSTSNSTLRNLSIMSFLSRSSNSNRDLDSKVIPDILHQSSESASQGTYLTNDLVRRPLGRPTIRSHSHKDSLSTAMMNSIKLTVVVIGCYIACSAPFITAQLWSVWYPMAMKSPIFTGPAFTILSLLVSLNSCVNPWIYLFFNRELVKSLKKVFCTKKERPQMYNIREPYTMTTFTENVTRTKSIRNTQRN